jgi:hypothetical protein
LKSLSAFCLLLSILCASILAGAQSTDATLSGVVVDPSGKVIQDADIEILNVATGVHYSSKTNDDGIYTVTILPPGEYRVQVSKAGFKALIKPGIVLNVQSAVALNFTLPIGATSESVTVEAGASTINTTDGSVSTVIDRNFVTNMPLNGRSFQDLLTLAPGVSQVPVNPSGGNGVGYSGEIVVNGQRTEANYFTVDGVSANTGAQPGNASGSAGFAGSVAGETALGSTQSLVSIDALQEFRATTSTYSAEYGRTPGGQFSFTTRSGTSEIHGTAYDYLRNDAMDASNWFNDYLGKPKGEERQNDFGGTIGGPIVLPHLYNGRQRTFFFGSYEGLRLDSPQPATKIEVPDMGLRQSAPTAVQPALNAFPVPNGGEDGSNDGLAYYIETVSYPAQIDNTSIRLDHHLSDRWNIFGRYAYTPSTNTTYSGAVSNSTVTNIQSATLGSTNMLGPHQDNELRFNFTRNASTLDSSSTELGGASSLALNSLPGFGNGNSGSLVFYLVYGLYPELNLRQTSSGQTQYNITDTYSWQIGHHNIRAGLDWRRLETDFTLNNPEEGIYFFNASEVQTNTALIGLATTSPETVVKPVYLNISTFIQDEWKVNSRLSLSLGLRWDVNPAPGDAAGTTPYTLSQTTNLETANLAPAGTALWKTDWHGLAPRLGFAYKLHQESGHETVLRAGYGIFYDLGSALGSGGYYGIGFVSNSEYFGASYPLTTSQLALPPPSVAAPYSGGVVYAFDPQLKLPYTMEYNVSLEQALESGQNLTLSYVGSCGRNLLSNFEYYPNDLGNQNFAASTPAYVTSNSASSSYNSLQAKYERSLKHGLQALLSYTWSHSIDDASANALLPYLLRGSSDFDIRNQFQAAATYDVPTFHSSGLSSSIVNHWGFDVRFQGRSALPVDIESPATIDPSTGSYYFYQPDFVQSQPVYLRGNQYPGKRIINYAAFESAPAFVQGNVPRNYARGFNALQADVAAHRTFPIYERLNLQFRAEAFNVLNHPQFGAIYNQLSSGSALFGYSYNTLNSQLGGLNPLYQIGGPRSLQMMLRLTF